MAKKRKDASPERATNLEQLLTAKEIVVTCGSGGVGKTTTAAAAAAMAASRIGGRVLVLTVDPAHGRRALDYERAMRGRNRLLAEDRADPA